MKSGDSFPAFLKTRNQIYSQEWHSRVLVGLVSSNIRAVDLLPEYSYDADEQNKVYLWINQHNTLTYKKKN